MALTRASGTGDTGGMMIETDGLGKTYGNGVAALLDLSLSIGEGEIFGFLGANGAGKSTTVRLLNGTLRPSAGTARVMGRDPDSPQVRLCTASLGETAAMYENLGVRENLRFFAAMYGLPRADTESRIGELLERMHLAPKGDLKLGSFSTGMKKRVQLARALLHRPRLLFLDEPTSGLDPESGREVTELIREVAREQGSTVFLCTHNLPLAERICDRYGFISRGRLVRAGTKEELVRASGRKPALRVRTTSGERRYELAGEDQGINAILQGLLAEGQTIIEALREAISLEDLYFELAGEHASGKEGA